MYPNATKLLISVRDAAEAAIALNSGVDWIDLKEPQAGSLGCPTLQVAQEVAQFLQTHSQRSVALGELRDLAAPSDLAVFAKLFPVLKVGLSHCISPDFIWQTRFKSLAQSLRAHGAELIPVAYADARTCSAPDLTDVLELAQQMNSSHLLIDTYTKDGSRLRDWLSPETIQTTITAARKFQCGVVLAGSLRLDDVQQLLPLHPAALAIRGAVCQSNQIAGRTSPIDPNKVATWRALLH